MLLSLAPVVLSDPFGRPRSSARGETAMMTAKSWWRLLAGGEAGGGAPVCPGVFVTRARQKSVLTRKCSVSSRP